MAATTGVRLTLKFNFPQRIRISGWAESYDMGYADLATAISASANIYSFMVDRCNLLGIGPTLYSATLSAYVAPVLPGDAPTRRPSLSLPVPIAPNEGDAYNPVYPFTAEGTFLADFSPTVLYISLQTSLAGTPVYRRNCWLAGIPDGADQTNSGQVTLGPVVTALTKFIKDLRNQGAALGAQNNISIQSVDRSAGNPIKKCTAWPAAGALYTVPAHGFVPGQPVIAEGMKVAPGGSCPRGRYLVDLTPTADTLSLQGAGQPSLPIKLGGFRAAKLAYNKVVEATPLGFTKRNKGRPSGLSVGRRRVSSIKRV